MKYYKIEMVIGDRLEGIPLKEVEDAVRGAMEDEEFDIESFAIKPIFGPDKEIENENHGERRGNK